MRYTVKNERLKEVSLQIIYVRALFYTFKKALCTITGKFCEFLCKKVNLLNFMLAIYPKGVYNTYR